MAHRPGKPCNHYGCNVLTYQAYCYTHEKNERKRTWKRIDEKRPSASSRGYGHKWHKARTGFLAEHPLCVVCEKAGMTVAAGVVDHIVPHKNDMRLFWDMTNWQALCAICHNRKSAMEGAFNHEMSQ